LVRYSGTESLLRVMVEGECDDTIRDVANHLVNIVKTHLG
jgi:phosphoglucosamine mutase